MEIGTQYRYKYITGDIFSPKYHERTGTYIRESIDKKYYIFASEMIDIAKFLVVYVLKTDILERLSEIEIEIERHIVDMISLFVIKSAEFITVRLNTHSPIQYIDFDRLDYFVHSYYLPGAGNGYLEAEQSWNESQK